VATLPFRFRIIIPAVIGWFFMDFIRKFLWSRSWRQTQCRFGDHSLIVQKFLRSSSKNSINDLDRWMLFLLDSPQMKVKLLIDRMLFQDCVYDHLFFNFIRTSHFYPSIHPLFQKNYSSLSSKGKISVSELVDY
jgi:hypothetical protein